VWGRQQQGESLVASRKGRRSGSPIPPFFYTQKNKIAKIFIKKNKRNKTKQNKFLDKKLKNTIQDHHQHISRYFKEKKMLTSCCKYTKRNDLILFFKDRKAEKMGDY
jgi:hypothetical protein